MRDIINTLLVSFVPAVITSFVSYLVASKKAKTEIIALQESNKHEIEKLICNDLLSRKNLQGITTNLFNCY